MDVLAAVADNIGKPRRNSPDVTAVATPRTRSSVADAYAAYATNRERGFGTRPW